MVDQVVLQSGMIEICGYDFSREIVFAVVVNNREGGFYFLSFAVAYNPNEKLRLSCLDVTIEI
jgi:hypothetical protein